MLEELHSFRCLLAAHTSEIWRQCKLKLTKGRSPAEGVIKSEAQTERCVTMRAACCIILPPNIIFVQIMPSFNTGKKDKKNGMKQAKSLFENGCERPFEDRLSLPWMTKTNLIIHRGVRLRRCWKQMFARDKAENMQKLLNGSFSMLRLLICF